MVISLKYWIALPLFPNQMPSSSASSFSGVFVFCFTLPAPSRSSNAQRSPHMGLTWTPGRGWQKSSRLFDEGASGVGMSIHEVAPLLPPQDVFYWPIYCAFISLQANRKHPVSCTSIHTSSNSMQTASLRGHKDGLTKFTLLSPERPGVLLQTWI